MNLMLFTRSLNAGGTERQLVLLAKGLAGRGHSVTVVLLYDGGALLPSLSGSDVQVRCIDKAGRWDIIRPLWRLRRLFRTTSAEVIYAMLPMQTAIAALLAPKSAKLIFGLRASAMALGNYDWLSSLAYRLEACLASRADAIIANAQAIRLQPPRGIDSRRIRVVANGIDTEAFHPDLPGRRRVRDEWGITEDALLVGVVARLDPMKDHENFLEAARSHFLSMPSSRFVCVGDGDPTYRRRLMERASSLGIADRVIWAGERQDLPAVYSALDIATLSSAFGEGFPNVLGEAMACGTPVVTTDVGDSRQIAEPIGVVVAPRDAVALANGWKEMWRRIQAGQAALGSAARAHILERFSVEAMVARTDQELRAVIEKKA